MTGMNFNLSLHIDNWQTIVQSLEDVIEFLSHEPQINSKELYELNLTLKTVLDALALQGVQFEQTLNIAESPSVEEVNHV